MLENTMIVSGLALLAVSLVWTLLQRHRNPARIPVRVLREQRRRQ